MHTDNLLVDTKSNNVLGICQFLAFIFHTSGLFLGFFRQLIDFKHANGHSYVGFALTKHRKKSDRVIIENWKVS